MAVVAVEKNIYKVEPLYQWDLNQSLVIEGLHLPSVPEIHFSTPSMSRAIVRPSTMDAAGTVTVDIPNSVLQKSGKLFVFVCVYVGDTFETLYKFEVQIQARPQPEGYQLEANDHEVYSFEALENAVQNAISSFDVFSDIGTKYSVVTSDAQGKISNAGTPKTDQAVLIGAPNQSPGWGTVLGLLGSVGGVMVETGSYEGDGTSGADHPNVLTFNHKPVLVYIQPANTTGLLILARDCSRARLFTGGVAYYTQAVSWSAPNGVAWYLNEETGTQFNEAGKVYNYVSFTTV